VNLCAAQEQSSLPLQVMFLLTVFIVTMAVLLTLLAWVISQIPDPKLVEVRKRRATTALSGLHGDTDGDGVLSQEEINEQLAEASAMLKLPITVVQGYWRTFQRYDLDDSGSVDAKELNNLLVDSIGHKLSEEELQNIMLDVDADGSGTLEFGEFCVLASRIDMGEQSPEELYEAFMLWSDGKDKIPGDVMRRALTTLGEKLTPEEADELMAQADTDKDGTIDYQEFVRAMAWQHQNFEDDEPISPSPIK